MKITPRPKRTIIQEVTKNPRVTSKDLQAFLALANVCVHESTIRKTLNKNGVHGRLARRKPLLSKTTWNDAVDYWKNVLWTEESKVELFG